MNAARSHAAFRTSLARLGVVWQGVIAGLALAAALLLWLAIALLTGPGATWRVLLPWLLFLLPILGAGALCGWLAALLVKALIRRRS